MGKWLINVHYIDISTYIIWGYVHGLLGKYWDNIEVINLFMVNNVN